jgi:hypothetical protein
LVFGRSEVALLGTIVVGAYMVLLAMPTLLADSSVSRRSQEASRRRE